MKFGIFYEHQLPKPWKEGLEQQLFQDALDPVSYTHLTLPTIYSV